MIKKGFLLLISIGLTGCSTIKKETAPEITSGAIKSGASQCFLTPKDLKELAKTEGHQFLDNVNFDVIYDNQHIQPYMVVYNLNYSVKNFNVPRQSYSNYWHKDDRVSASTQQECYSGTEFEKGHMAPAEDFAFSKEAALETFYYSNASPQYKKFNSSGGAWWKLERDIRFTNEGQIIQVISGPLGFSKSRTKSECEKPPYIPIYFYKIVLQEVDGECKANVFVLKQEKIKTDYCENNFADSVKLPKSISNLLIGKKITNKEFCDIKDKRK